MSKLIKVYYTSSGTWTAPAGVKEVMLIGCGGGGGGGGGNAVSAGAAPGGGGGGGALQSTVTVSVTPGTSYSITIGDGGAVCPPGLQDGYGGQDTTFDSLATFGGASGGRGALGSASGYGGHPIKLSSGTNIYVTNNNQFAIRLPGTGGIGGITTPVAGERNLSSSSSNIGGNPGVSAGLYKGGGGGGAGPQGNGANGGDGNNLGAGMDGSSAPANSGGGGGGAGGGNTIGGSGGAGGSGYLYIIWSD
jgi:hypothetical protein